MLWDASSLVDLGSTVKALKHIKYEHPPIKDLTRVFFLLLLPDTSGELVARYGVITCRRKHSNFGIGSVIAMSLSNAERERKPIALTANTAMPPWNQLADILPKDEGGQF